MNTNLYDKNDDLTLSATRRFGSIADLWSARPMQADEDALVLMRKAVNPLAVLTLWDTLLAETGR